MLILVSLCVTRSGRPASTSSARQRLALQGELDLRPGQGDAAGDVRRDRLLQRGEALRRVVKVGNRVVQPRRGQVRQHALEFAERFRRLVRLVRPIPPSCRFLHLSIKR